MEQSRGGGVQLKDNKTTNMNDLGVMLESTNSISLGPGPIQQQNTQNQYQNQIMPMMNSYQRGTTQRISLDNMMQSIEFNRKQCTTNVQQNSMLRSGVNMTKSTLYHQPTNNIMNMSRNMNMNTGNINSMGMGMFNSVRMGLGEKKKKQNIMVMNNPNMMEMSTNGMINPINKVSVQPLSKCLLNTIKQQLSSLPQYWWTNDKSYSQIFKFQEYASVSIILNQNLLSQFKFAQQASIIFIKNGNLLIKTQNRGDIEIKQNQLVDFKQILQNNQVQGVIGNNQITEIGYYTIKQTDDFLKQVSLMNFNRILQVLENTYFLNLLHHNVLKELCFNFQIVKFKAGTILINEAKTNQNLYIIEKGSLGLYKGGILTRILQKNDFVGENTIIRKKEFFQVSVESDCTLLTIPNYKILQNKNTRQQFEPLIYKNQLKYFIDDCEELEVLVFNERDLNNFKIQKVSANQVLQLSNINDLVLILEGQFQTEKNIHYKQGQCYSNVFRKKNDNNNLWQLVSTQDSIVAVLPYEDYQKIIKQSPMFPVQDESDSQIESSEYEGLKNVNVEDINVLDHLGYGNFSVCLLVQIKNNQYALKYMHKYYVEEFEMQGQMIQEKNVFQRLRGNFFPKLYRTMQDEDYVIMLMQYIKGTTIEQFINQQGLIDPTKLNTIIKQMVLGLNNMHSQKVIHRDIKLQNFMISSNYLIKYIDFGFSKILQTDSKNQEEKVFTRIGTPHYMSPEVICGTGYTYEADCWALAVCIYEIVFGYVPWGENLSDPYEVNKLILAQPLKFPENVNIAISDKLQELLQGMLNKRLKNRLKESQQIMMDEYFMNQNWQVELDQTLNESAMSIESNDEEDDDTCYQTLDLYLMQTQQNLEHNIGHINSWDHNFQ